MVLGKTGSIACPWDMMKEGIARDLSAMSRSPLSVDILHYILTKSTAATPSQKLLSRCLIRGGEMGRGI